MLEIKGLIIDSPHIDNIMSGKKTWEMRTTGTKQRGTVALIRKGSGQIVGVAEIEASIGPLIHQDLLENMSKHLISSERLNDPKVQKYKYAWAVRNARALTKPINYVHPSGAVIWVKLSPEVQAAVLHD
jgi:hypothetical protein